MDDYIFAIVYFETDTKSNIVEVFSTLEKAEERRRKCVESHRTAITPTIHILRLDLDEMQVENPMIMEYIKSVIQSSIWRCFCITIAAVIFLFPIYWMITRIWLWDRQ